jgi:hypothetical protein
MNILGYNKILKLIVPALAGAACLCSSTAAKAATITYNPGGDDNLYCSSAGGTIGVSDPNAWGSRFPGMGTGIDANGYSSGSQWAGGTCSGSAAPANTEAMRASLWINSNGSVKECYAFASGNWVYNTDNAWGVDFSVLPGQGGPLGQVNVNFGSLCGAGNYTLFIETAVLNSTNGTGTWDYGYFQTPWTYINIPPAGFTN